MQLKLEIEQSTHSDHINKFSTSKGADIYQLPLEAFPGFWVFAYLVQFEDYQVLIDTGSGYGNCNNQLVEGFERVKIISKRETGLSFLTHVLITHGHIDHFGGLAFVKEHSGAEVGIHELDLRNVTNTEERITIVSKRLNIFLAEAGIKQDSRTQLIQMYKLTKLDFCPVNVEFTFEEIGMELGPFKFLHVPGHCPGQVVIRLHDILFSGDHILSEISPHQAPERLVMNTGLTHYLQSLEKVKCWADGIKITLGGHNQPIYQLQQRIEEIKNIHRDRLEEILEFLESPKTIEDVSFELFNVVHGYNVLLALEEAGAHVEYLYQRGCLEIDNLEDFSEYREIIPIQYVHNKELMYLD